MVDILAFGAHPDDVELSAGGTLIKQIKNGSTVGIVDLTMGEMGTRGTTEIRATEAENAMKIIGANFRENLEMPDSFIDLSKKSIEKVVQAIRTHKPKIVLCNAIKDRHPEHRIASKLVSKACFISGLTKFETFIDGKKQDSHRPKNIYHYIQDQWINPDFVMDISDEIDQKIKAIKAFESQFYNPKSSEPNTPISSKDFLDSIMSKANLMGRTIDKSFGEGFTVERPIGTSDLMNLF
ncbi:MAG: bacillithiol biosynthesis deacetylase BshB1 [Flavobacteriales bacterium]|nr:bacillithiol biosynthesis deacetylase BshB1 [Flavobacteriales bacterium]